jgi:hypothetical protein
MYAYNIEITVPYLPSLSKNKKYAFFGCKALNKDHVAAQNIIAYKVKSAMLNMPMPKKEKIKIDIFVSKPNMRSDPANYIDGALDAIKKVIGVDDNYYCGSWDWTVDKLNNYIKIKICYN